MRVLAFDPGAERMGWAVLEDGPKPVYVASGIIRFHRRPNEEYQHYKLRLEEHYTYVGPELLSNYHPDRVVNETVPAVGFNNATQADLAKTAITVIHAMAYERDFPVYQIGATTIKTQIGGSKKATKVKVRNGVIMLLPELAGRKKEWVKVFDESDAIATGLTALGYSILKVI
jgi:Holliday junction resolvasome RuvABC endonuclease subunit